jgi:NAD dependent epimerase/dehydratase family enzyme
MRTPAFMIRMVLGEFAGVLLASQRAVPQTLLQHRFSFDYPEIEAAVNAVAHGEAA